MYKPLNIPLEEFLRPFFDPGEKVCIRIFDDRKTGTFKGAKLETSIAEISALEPMLHKHNQQDRGIYFVVNYGGHEDGDITRVNAQYMECDDLSLEDQLAQIEAFPLQPSLIVKTRKSLHTYWLMSQRNTGPDHGVAAFRRIQKKLIAQFKGDKTCVNESRVLRLPGFLHCKQEPVMVECIKFSPELRYMQAELEAVLPAINDGQTIIKPAAGTRHGLKLVRRCEFIKHCSEHASSLSEHDWYAMITNLAVFEGGDKAIHALSARYPGYKAAETQGKISHFLASGTRPMTCGTIAEKGFKCPRISDATCDCKAPAAMRYKPLTVEELRMFLKDAPVSKSAVDNIQTALEFTRSYLFNIDPVIAATFIEHEMKEYFALKSGDMKPLSSEQRELCKTHMASKETRRETAGVELHEWYEMTDRGGLRFIPGLLADHLASNVDAFYGAGSYFFYQNGVYSESEDLWAAAKAREFMIPRYTTMNTINDAVGQWRMLIRKPVREINCNAFMINVRNGLYNVLNDTFKPHSPDYYSTVQINATYDPGAKCPQFLRFLISLLPDEEIYLMQEIFGYFLIPVNKAQKSFVFVGAPNAGKSTLLSVVQEILLGSENVSNIPWQNLADRFNKAELFGKLANIFADLPSKSIDDNGMFKALTGEDYITAERKNKDPFSFRPYARLLFSCNEIPRNYGDRSDGFYRRLIIIRFDKSVPEDRRDPNLREKLSVERDGILMWSLAGLKRLIANSYQFTETDTTRAELRRYRIESNSVLSFAEEFCKIDAAKTTLRDELFMHYREYCHNAGMKPMSQGMFNKELETSQSSIKRGRDKLSKRRVWQGITYCEGGAGAD
jgi:putative DNA primase/helicase